MAQGGGPDGTEGGQERPQSRRRSGQGHGGAQGRPQEAERTLLSSLFVCANFRLPLSARLRGERLDEMGGDGRRGSAAQAHPTLPIARLDRKSTRLTSSHI